MKNAIQTPTPVESKISEVTVYLSGAQVTRTAVLPADAQKIIFENLPAKLQAESIQVSAGKGISIRSVEHAVNYMQAVDYTKEITELQAKMEDLEDERKNEENKVELGKLEEAMFAENMRLAGSESGLKAEELKAAVLFYNERMAAVREERMACSKRLEKIKKEIANVKSQLGSFTRVGGDQVSEVTVCVAAEDDCGEARELEFSYFVYDAGWQPSYDIRAKDTSGSIDLHYKASVSQSTGENWEDVKLVLSTGNPSIGGVCPELKPWYLDFYREPVSRYRSEAPMASMARMAAIQKNLMAPAPAEAEVCDDDRIMLMELSEPALAAPVLSVTTESITSVEYSITDTCSVASGDGGQDVEITMHSLPAEFRYFSISKIEREVFLLAAVKGWERLNLIAGEAAIFFENRYVGTSYIDPRKADEEIDLSLGADKSVIVTRVRGKDFKAKTMVGVNEKQTRQWELTARNLKATPIEIEMLDQVPVSVNKQIVVDAVDISGAELDKDTGILTWKFALAPAESKTVAVKYTVTNPKSMRVVLD